MNIAFGQTPQVKLLNKVFQALLLILPFLMYTAAVAQNIPLVKAQVKLMKPSKTNAYTDVRCILQDKAGNMWFGTAGAGVYRFDGKHFTYFTEKDGLMNNAIYTMIEDRAGRIWVGTYDGAYVFDGQRFSHFTLPGYDSMNYNIINVSTLMKRNYYGRTVQSIVQDKIGNIWFGTGSAGLYCFNGKFFTNYTFNDKQWKSTVMNSFNSKKCNTSGNSIHSLFVDSKGNLWFSSYEEGGLFKYDGKSFTTPIANSKSKFEVVRITEDKTGKLWFATYETGIYSYNGKSLTQYTEKDGLCYKTFTSATTDKKGNLWFGSALSDYRSKKEGCISRYDGTSFTTLPLKGLENTSVWSIFEDRSGNLWIGAKNVSLYRYDGQTITDYTDYTIK